MEAVVVGQSDSQVFVRCPFCPATHKHGLMGRDNVNGQTRGSHCGKGDYTIISREDALKKYEEKKAEINKKVAELKASGKTFQSAEEARTEMKALGLVE